MSLTNDIPTKLRVPAQLALDAKSVVTTLSQLQTLGADNNLAYTYYKGMPVICAENLGLYRWRPVEEGETGGTLPSNFIYPAGIVSEDGVVYSNIAYNFFKETTLTVENLTELVQINNVGEGVEIYKDSTIVGDTTQFNFRTIVQENQGTGKSFLRDIQQTTDELKVRVKTLVSDNLTITATDEEVRIETPMTASIPALYVNNLYVPTYNEWLTENKVQNGGTEVPGFVFRGKGTIAQPFTDSIVYPLAGGSPTITPNTAIQNALNGDVTYAFTYSYVGTGSRLLPQRSGQKIIVQSNNIGYTFPNDLNYSNLYIKFEETIIFSTTGYIVDMDNPAYFDSETSQITIEIAENKNLNISNTLGFRNSGNTSSTPPSYNTGRTINFRGEGILYSDYNGADVLTKYIFNGEGNNNDDGLHYYVKCKVRAIYQGIYLCKNKMRIDFYNQLVSGQLLLDVNLALQAFRMTGGQVRFYEKGSVAFGNSNGRTYGFTFEPQGTGIGYCLFQLNKAQLGGGVQYCFARLNDEAVNFLAFNSPSGDGFSTTNPGTNTVIQGLFQNLGASKWEVDMKNCVFSYTGIDFNKVDLTLGNQQSTVNFIGNDVVESLIIKSSRAQAIADGVPLYSAYLKTSGVAYPSTSQWVRDIVLPA